METLAAIRVFVAVGRRPEFAGDLDIPLGGPSFQRTISDFKSRMYRKLLFCVACVFLVYGTEPSYSATDDSKLIESISEKNYKDLASLFAQAPDVKRIEAVRLLLPSANREISKAMLDWLETQDFLPVGSEEATRTKMIWRETAILIAKGLGVELEKTPYFRREYLKFCADMRQRLAK